MKASIHFLLVSLLFTAKLANSAELKIPEKTPQLETTETVNLGTREDNIGLAPGSLVSPFEVNDHMGKATSFKDLREHAPLLVIFYRGGWCPYCNVQIHQLTEAWPEFKKRGITPVLISADKVDASALVSRTYEIPFPVLSDPDLIAHNIFEIVMKLDDDFVTKYKKVGINVEDWSGKKHHQFAVSSAFIVNQKGMVEWSHSSKDYKQRPSVNQLLQVVDTRKNK